MGLGHTSWKNAALAGMLAFGGMAGNAGAATLLTETWNAASVGAVTIPGSLTADNTWTTAFTATGAGALSIIDAGSGDLRLSHPADGTADQYNILTAPFTPSPETRKIRVVYEHIFTANGTNGQRTWAVTVKASGGSLDGYQIRMSGENDDRLFDFAVVDNGVLPPPVFSIPVPVPPNAYPGLLNKLYRVTVTFQKSGADTLVEYQVYNVTDAVDVYATATFTITGSAVDAGTNFDTVDLRNRRRTNAALDNITVTSDTTAPVVTVTGDNPLNLTCGQAYSEAGATATDDFDGNVTGNISPSGSVDTNVVGPYVITYSVTDASGNTGQATRTVNVVGPCPDTTAPEISLTGAASVNVNCGATYNDAGATATDNVDGVITNSIVTVNPVNTTVPGQYTVTYNVEDAAGNDADEVTRTVTVLNNCSGDLQISQDGPASVNAETGDTVVFEVSATTGTGPLSYQWYKVDGAKADQQLGGEISSTLTLTNVQPVNAGAYYCEVSDSDETLSSPLFTLVVSAQAPVASLAGLWLTAGVTAAAGAAALKRRQRTR